MATFRGQVELSLAFLNFFQSFRRVYIGEQSQKASNVFGPLDEQLHFGDQYIVLNEIMLKWLRSFVFYVVCEVANALFLFEVYVICSPSRSAKT